jgi:hypothetical protein
MAFDGKSAADIYRAALEHLGVSRRETAGASTAALRVLIQNRTTPGSRAWRDTPAMARDSKAPSVLDAVLAGIKPPRYCSNRNDFRR